MSDHLPECSVRTYTTDDGMVYEVAGDLCICPALRACEQRVRDSADQFVKAHMEGKQVGFWLGVQAARDAVAGLPWDNSGAIDPVDALAAIDALRECPND